jgi:hypothetical protein
MGQRRGVPRASAPGHRLERCAVRLYVRRGFSDAGLRLPLREGSDVMTMSMTKDL